MTQIKRQIKSVKISAIRGCKSVVAREIETYKEGISLWRRWVPFSLGPETGARAII
jgi:hypothetical protein